MTPSPRSQSWSVVASDLDGTLLDSGRGVTKRTASAVERVRRNDGRFLMVTGRPVRWITQIVEQLGTTDPVIALNGAVVWDPVSGDVLSSRPLDLELVIDLVERLSEQDFSPERFERIRALVGDAAQVTHSGNEALIEIAAPGVHKAATLASLVDGWALSPDDVIAFGDQVNDEEMLAWAGWGVAMGNAAPHVQRLADEVTLSNDQAGVARILEREFPTA